MIMRQDFSLDSEDGYGLCCCARNDFKTQRMCIYFESLAEEEYKKEGRYPKCIHLGGGSCYAKKRNIGAMNNGMGL